MDVELQGSIPRESSLGVLREPHSEAPTPIQKAPSLGRGISFRARSIRTIAFVVGRVPSDM